MKILLLMRHAKSDWKKSGLTDFERPLNKRGRHAAPKMGRFLRAQGLTPDLLLASSAERARQTAEAVTGAGEFDVELTLRRDLYLATWGEYLDALERLPEDVECVLVVGHNPGLEELVESLTGATEFLPTAAVAHVTLSIDRWKDIRSGEQGRLEAVWRAKELPG